MKTLTINIRIADNDDYHEKRERIIGETSGIAGLNVQIKKAEGESAGDYLDFLEKTDTDFVTFYSGNDTANKLL